MTRFRRARQVRSGRRGPMAGLTTTIVYRRARVDSAVRCPYRKTRARHSKTSPLPRGSTARFISSSDRCFRPISNIFDFIFHSLFDNRT